MTDYIVLSSETKLLAEQVNGGWTNIFGMGISSVVTYCSKSDRYFFWSESQLEQLCKYLNGKLVVTFNGIMFDSKLILGNNRHIESNGTTSNDKYKWINADIFVEMWRHIFKMDRSNYPELLKKIQEQKFPKDVFNLNSIAKATIGQSNIGSNDIATMMFHSGELINLYQYNLQNTRMINQLYKFIKERKYMITGGYDVVSFK